MSPVIKNLIYLAKKHPVGLGCGLLSLILLVLIYLRSDKIAEAESRLTAVTATGQRLKTNISYSIQLTTQLESLTNAISKIQERSVRADDLAQNLQYYYKLETDAGVTLTDLRQGGPVNLPRGRTDPPATFLKVPYNVGVQGTFENVMIFLRKLENGERFSNITSASLRPSGSQNATLSLSVELLGQP